MMYLTRHNVLKYSGNITSNVTIINVVIQKCLREVKMFLLGSDLSLSINIKSLRCSLNYKYEK